MRGPRDGLREDPALGRGGRGKGATPLADGWPPGPGPPSRPTPPLWPTGGIARGPKAPPHSPPPPPTQARERAGWQPPPPPPPAPTPAGEPQARPSAPTHRRNGDTVRATAAGPAPANPHRRAGATRTTEHEGGRAPHDPPVTTAHSEGTEGGFAGQLGPPGERSTGRPSPPPPRGGTSAPTARARRKGARQRHEESQKGVPQAAARNESGEAAARHPPRGKGDGPPPPERGAGA